MLAGYNTTTGQWNTMIGAYAGHANTTGSNNTYLGDHAQGAPTITHATALGSGAFVNASNSMALGGTGAFAVNVGIGVAAPQAELEVNGFTMLGSNAPKVKMPKLTATTSAIQGNAVTVAHGLTAAKILAVDVLVETGIGVWMPPNYTVSPGFQFQFNVQTTSILVANVPAASANILSKPFKVLITYEE